MTSASRVVPSIPWMDSSKWKVNKLTKADCLLIVSDYTKTVLLLAAIQISISFCVVIISSVIIRKTIDPISPKKQLIVTVISVLIALLIALVIAVLKMIRESYPLNFVFAIFYSIFLSTALEVLNTEFSILLTLAAFAISLITFTCALLIGAAITTSLADHARAMLILFGVISFVFLGVWIARNVLQLKAAVMYVDIVAEILLFFITIFVSHLTVGKSRYLFFYPNYALASIFLYTVFFANLSINIDIFDSICNASSILKCKWTY
ncbi:unnamed protein product [Schistosoma turkestanicum]|nr:unnamed protein product [Schistosoma turkestanicum]